MILARCLWPPCASEVEMAVTAPGLSCSLSLIARAIPVIVPPVPAPATSMSIVLEGSEELSREYYRDQWHARLNVREAS
jgi:hypothetical protein